MTIKYDLIALLGTLLSVSAVTCSLRYFALLKKVLIPLLGLGLGIVTFFNDFPPPPAPFPLLSSFIE